jgi:hypothetical protein
MSAGQNTIGERGVTIISIDIGYGNAGLIERFATSARELPGGPSKNAATLGGRGAVDRNAAQSDGKAEPSGAVVVGGLAGPTPTADGGCARLHLFVRNCNSDRPPVHAPRNNATLVTTFAVSHRGAYGKSGPGLRSKWNRSSRTAVAAGLYRHQNRSCAICNRIHDFTRCLQCPTDLLS